METGEREVVDTATADKKWAVVAAAAPEGTYAPASSHSHMHQQTHYRREGNMPYKNPRFIEGGSTGCGGRDGNDCKERQDHGVHGGGSYNRWGGRY